MTSREEFEAWMTAEQWFHGSDFEWDERRNCYSQFGIHLAYKAWQAASKASEQQLAAVVAENATLKTYRPQPHGAAMMEALDAFFEREDVPEQGMMASFEILCCKRPSTPATDAILNEVRAEGVEMFARNAEGAEQGNGLMKAIARRAIKFAAQLRQGGAA